MSPADWNLQGSVILRDVIRGMVGLTREGRPRTMTQHTSTVLAAQVENGKPGAKRVPPVSRPTLCHTQHGPMVTKVDSFGNRQFVIPRQGSESCNTDPSETTTDTGKTESLITVGKNTVKVVASGIDWLKVSAYGPRTPQNSLERIAAAKETSVQGGKGLVELAGRDWSVAARGQGVGANYLPFVLQAGALRVCMRETERSKAPSLVLEAQGAFCAGRDPQKVKDDLVRQVADLGVKSDRIAANRVDIYTDVEGVTTDQIYRMVLGGQTVRQARHMKAELVGYENVCQTLYLGKRSNGIMLRVYDKRAELELDPEKRERYLAAHGLNELPEVLTRIEWELRTDFFRETYVCADVQDLFKQLGTLTQWLFHTWFRVTDGVVDRNHADRSLASEWWSTVAKKAAKAFDGFESRRRAPDKSVSVEKCKEGVAAYAASLMGVQGLVPGTVQEALQYIGGMFDAEQDAKFREKCIDRVIQCQELNRDLERDTEGGDKPNAVL